MTKRKRKAPRLVVMRPLVAGIDVGSGEHWVAGPAKDDGEENVRVFGSTTPQLEKLANWLVELEVESVAMESTYVYWIPLYELLESRGIEVVLVNARHLRNVPGRKTDVSDCQWLQILHSCGLLRGSFRPGDAICQLRALRRQMANLTAERTKCVQWMQKALDQMNVLVHRAVSDLTGKTGMSILRAIVAGERRPERLAQLRDRRCKKSVEVITEYLTGNWRDDHLFNLASALALYDAVEQQIASYESRLQEMFVALQPPERRELAIPKHPNIRKHYAFNARREQQLRTALWRFAGVDLTHIDGISPSTAQIILTEVGLDLSVFPTEKHFISWLRLCPRTPISGGKPLRKRPNGLGSSRIAGALRIAALSLQRSKTALGAAFRRKSRHKGGAVAVFATARKLAQLVYRMLRYGMSYVDVGAAAYEDRFRDRQLHGLRTSANSLGYDLVPQAVTPD